MLTSKLAELGLTARPEWVARVGDDDGAAGFESLMNSHMGHCVMAGSLPEIGPQGDCDIPVGFFQPSFKELVDRKHLVMIEDFVDVSKPVKFHQLPAATPSDPFADDTEDAVVGQASDSTGASKNRVLKMILTDGCRRVTAIEVVPIVDIPQQLSALPGAKLMISGSPDICASCVLLYPCHVKFLGGSCPELQARYRQSLAEKIARADPLRLSPTDSEASTATTTAMPANAARAALIGEGNSRASQSSTRSGGAEMGRSTDACSYLDGNVAIGSRPGDDRLVRASTSTQQMNQPAPPLCRAASLPVFGEHNHVTGSTLQRMPSATGVIPSQSLGSRESQSSRHATAPSVTDMPSHPRSVHLTDGNTIPPEVGHGTRVDSRRAPDANALTVDWDGEVPPSELVDPPRSTTESSEVGQATAEPSVTESDRARLLYNYVRTPPKKRPQSGPSILPPSPARPSGAMRKRPRTAAEGSVVSVTQSMHDDVQHIIDVTPQSAITLSSCSADPGPMQALDDVNCVGDMTGFEDEGAVNEGDTSLVAAAVRAVSGREVVLERDGSTFYCGDR
ncbi:hypothetical protein FOZ60_002258 [Perkinsus olseni]|uniref:RecQ-mediated genome instability protein 1 n=1 Tax=Perkinsus olseni TaxID=32597 RepID=A0A7J6NY97_PEROL|nr:hypothetical protein FOZ60_002258 [Perkinsus olseni]